MTAANTVNKLDMSEEKVSLSENLSIMCFIGSMEFDIHFPGMVLLQ